MQKPVLQSVALVTVLAFAACTSSTVIRSNPTGAQVYLDGAPVGRTPFVMSDTKIVGSSTTVRLEAPGYETANAVITRNEEFDVGGCILGVFTLVGYLWIMRYKADHYYELRPLGQQPQGYPPPGGYPPPQGGYPPPQGGYPPPQQGYPPPGGYR